MRFLIVTESRGLYQTNTITLAELMLSDKHEIDIIDMDNKRLYYKNGWIDLPTWDDEKLGIVEV